VKLYRAGLTAGALAVVATLAACSSSGGGAGGGGTTSSSGTGGTGGTGNVNCSSGTLNAEGSTAQANAMTAWINAYTKECSGAKVNYNPTGSGDGVSAFSAGQVDFAGSDAALDPAEEMPAAQKSCGSAPLDLPMVVGPIAIAYKLNGVSNLTLTPELIAKIFTGKITSWNDPAIAAKNSGVSLPSTKISVIYRSDSSGTTQNFERYLAATDATDFTAEPAKDNAAQVFTGQGKAKSQGVAQGISATEGAIGYDEFSYAVQAGLSTAAIDNGGGAVELSKDTASAAAGAAKVVGKGDDLSLQLDYATKVPGAYPLILVTYEIVCTKYSDSAKGTFVKNFLDYTANEGQSQLAQLGYAPLPSDLQAKVNASIAKIS
jgi:phosphate transport system substrate-binding protein